MRNRGSFDVSIPIETFEGMIKEKGLADEAVLDHQELYISSVTYNEEGFVLISGDLISKMDA